MNGFVFDINSYLRLVPTDMLLICISTLLIVLIAKHFFWDKVTVYLNARSEVIQGDLDAAKAAKAEGAQYKQQYEEQRSEPLIPFLERDSAKSTNDNYVSGW